MVEFQPRMPSRWKFLGGMIGTDRYERTESGPFRDLFFRWARMCSTANGHNAMPAYIPLTCFEELMLHQDCSAWPASCFLRLRFSGRLDQTAFESAVQTVLPRHPLLSATVEECGRGKYRWRVDQAEPEILWFDDLQASVPELSRLDLSVRQGVRWIVHSGADRSEVLIQFHHACCDGIGIYQVARELLYAYAAEWQGEAAPAFPVLDPELLQRRESTGLCVRAFLRLALQQVARLPSVWNFFTRTPSQLVPHQPGPVTDPPPRAFPDICAHHFDTQTSLALKAAVQDGTTLNDVLTRDLFLAMREFQKQQQYGNDTSWLRLMIPVSLRTVKQYRASAANMIGAVFLERRGLSMRSPKALLQGLQNELAQIKRLKLGHLFVFALAAQRCLPGGLRRAARPNRCQISAVFTNIGRVLTKGPDTSADGRWKCGNVVLECTEAAAPIARNVCSSFSAVWYANRLSLTLHHDARVFNAAGAERMLKLFVRQVEISAGVRELQTVDSAADQGVRVG